MDDNNTLQATLVPHPRHSRLELRICEKAIDVVIISCIEDNSLQWHRIELDAAATSPIKSLEDAVYRNPLLLADFNAIDVLIATKRRLVVPAAHADNDNIRSMFEQLYPDAKLEVVINPIGDNGDVIAIADDADRINFIRRTFNNPKIADRITPLCRYFGIKNRLGNAGKFHVHLADNTIDIIAYGADGLLMANTFESTAVTDDLYYTLAAAKSLNFDNNNDQMLLSGDADRREALIPLLRKHISYVMPMIFPSAMFKAGKDSLSAPFELITLPLCE
jgi:hypothetical protein